MNQSFLGRQNYNLWENNSKRNLNFCKTFLATPSPLFWAYLGITFVHGPRLKKIIFPWSLSVFYLQKEIQKIKTKIHPINWYLLEISFLSRRDNSPLGVKNITLKSPYMTIAITSNEHFFFNFFNFFNF